MKPNARKDTTNSQISKCHTCILTTYPKLEQRDKAGAVWNAKTSARTAKPTRASNCLCIPFEGQGLKKTEAFIEYSSPTYEYVCEDYVGQENGNLCYAFVGDDSCIRGHLATTANSSIKVYDDRTVSRSKCFTCKRRSDAATVSLFSACSPRWRPRIYNNGAA